MIYMIIIILIIIIIIIIIMIIIIIIIIIIIKILFTIIFLMLMQHATLTSQILFIFSLFVDSVEMINPWKFHLSTSYDSQVIKIWKFSVIAIFLVILSSWNLGWVRFLGREIQKLHLEDLKINKS